MKKCFFTILVIVLSACQSSPISGPIDLVSDLVARPGDALFWDDFSDTSRNWPQASSTDGSLGVFQEAYRIQVLSTRYEIVASPGRIFRDVQVEADAARQAGPLQNLFGLVCRSNQAKEFYFFAISSDGYYVLGKIMNGRTTLLGQEMMAYSASILQGDNNNHLRLDCIGETLSGYVNGQLVASSTDADLALGEAGLVAGTLDAPGVEVVFDNFVVYKP
jgi:hypothetical protein